MYRANIDTYLSNSKASVLFIKNIYEPKNEAEKELLEEALKLWKVTKEQEQIKPIKEEKKEKNKK